MSIKNIIVKGAREHNLKNIDVEIPRDNFVVITGVSGSGKSSLAFDTIYSEGQRRYVESLSSYARQFLGQMDKPDVDYIEGLSPAIAIDQKTTSKNPRSTVGTVTEIYDYLRLLYARIGVPHCPVCGKEIKQQTVDQIVDQIMGLSEDACFKKDNKKFDIENQEKNSSADSVYGQEDIPLKIQILAPIVRGRKGEHLKEFENAKKNGYVRVRVDGVIYDLSEDIKLDKNKKHNIEIVVDRLVVKKEVRTRLAESIEISAKLAGGLTIINVVDREDITFSQNYACPDHGVSIDELAPRMFSFNNPFGACDKCAGLGVLMKIDENLIIPNRNLSIEEGAIKGSGWLIDRHSESFQRIRNLIDEHGIDFTLPVKDLPRQDLDLILYGTDQNSDIQFEGIINNLERRFKETQSSWIKEEIESYMGDSECDKCHGKRLSKESLAVTVGGINIIEFCEKSIEDSLDFIINLKISDRDKLIADMVLKEIIERLGFLKNVGLEYLSLSRASGTLSGGESQRIRLATQIGSSLTGVLYILDEPSIGLHQRDNQKLLLTLKKLRDIGNTIIVVEHDDETMYAADYIIDVGPGAGVLGGEIVAHGGIDKIKSCKKSETGQYLSKTKKIEVPTKRREGNGKSIKIFGAKENNLKDINVEIPLGKFVCITGVSGSGKSSLMNEILYKYLANKLNGTNIKPGQHEKIEGVEALDKVIDIDQSPIGRTPRSNPATYTGLFTHIRELYASTNDAKTRGFSSGRFSFNVRGGRCEACKGDGIIKIEMHFLPDVYVPCDVCKGKRYNRETLDIKYKNKNIHDILELTVQEGLEFFSNIPKIEKKLRTLYEVGLGYIKVGQSATTLSGGEAQRVKLATELSKRQTGKTIYILDEPTTGLHIADVHKLIDVLQRLVDGGNSVVVIEHNLDMIKTADHIIDLGPEGGNKGGYIVAEGTPEQIVEIEGSYTGKYLKPLIK